MQYVREAVEREARMNEGCLMRQVAEEDFCSSDAAAADQRRTKADGKLSVIFSKKSQIPVAQRANIIFGTLRGNRECCAERDTD